MNINADLIKINDLNMKERKGGTKENGKSIWFFYTIFRYPYEG